MLELMELMERLAVPVVTSAKEIEEIRSGDGKRLDMI